MRRRQAIIGVLRSSSETPVARARAAFAVEERELGASGARLDDRACNDYNSRRASTIGRDRRAQRDLLLDNDASGVDRFHGIRFRRQSQELHGDRAGNDDRSPELEHRPRLWRDCGRAVTPGSRVVPWAVGRGCSPRRQLLPFDLAFHAHEPPGSPRRNRR